MTHPTQTPTARDSVLSEIPTHAAAPFILSRRALRKVLNQALGTPSQLDAFLIDFYPEVFNQTSLAMDRETKLNLLLSCITEEQLTQTVRREYPDLQEQVCQKLAHAPGAGDDKRSKYAVVLSATIDAMDVHKVHALLNHLRRFTADSELTIEQLRSGSVIITCTGSHSGFLRLSKEFYAGRLNQLIGYRVKDITLSHDGQPASQLNRLPETLLPWRAERPEQVARTVPLGTVMLGAMPLRAPVIRCAPAVARLPPAVAVDTVTAAATAYTSRSIGAAACVTKPSLRSPQQSAASLFVATMTLVIAVGIGFKDQFLVRTTPPTPAQVQAPPAAPPLPAAPVVATAPESAPSPQVPPSMRGSAVSAPRKSVPRPIPSRSEPMKTPRGPGFSIEALKRLQVDVSCAQGVLCKKSAAELIVRLCLHRHLPDARVKNLALHREARNYEVTGRPTGLRGAALEPFVGCVRAGMPRLYGSDEAFWPSRLLIAPSG